MAYTYAARTDKSFDKVRDFFASKCSGLAVREVSGENEHWHWFLRSDTKIASLRELLRRAVPELKGNGGYSLKDCPEPDRYLQYICKGSGRGRFPEVSWSYGLDLDANKYHDAYWEENQERKRSRKLSVSEKVLAAAKESNCAWDDVRQLCQLYIRQLRTEKKSVNLFAVKAAVRGLQLQLCTDDQAVDELAAQVFVS